MEEKETDKKIVVLFVISLIISVGLGGCHQKTPSEKNEEERLLDNFVGIWKTSLSNIRGHSSSPPRWYYSNDSITITFFSDRTLKWDVDTISTQMNYSRKNGIEETYSEYTYSGYYKMLAGKLVIVLNGVTIYNYFFSNNSQNLSLTPFFDIPNLRQWFDNLTMNLSRYIDESQNITEEQRSDADQLYHFYGTWMTRITEEINDEHYIDYYNDSVRITFYPNGFFSSTTDRTGIVQWLDEPSTQWHPYNRTNPVAGYYEIKGKKLVLTAVGVGIFFFVFSNDSHTLSLVPFNSKNTPLQRFPFDSDSQTLILKKQNEDNRQNVEEQEHGDKTTDEIVGSWKTSNVVNESQYYTRQNYTLTFFPEKYFIINYNSTTLHKQIQFTSNNSYAYQGYYEFKSDNLVITSICVFVFNFTFSNNSSMLTLRPSFTQQPIIGFFGEEIVILTKF